MTMTTARRVILESPYAADTDHEVELNLTYARLCMRDCLFRNEFPFASHLLYTQPGIIDDRIAHERRLGISAGFDWGQFAEWVVVYTDFGISEGMQLGIDKAVLTDRRVEFRHLLIPNGEKLSVPIDTKIEYLRTLWEKRHPVYLG